MTMDTLLTPADIAAAFQIEVGTVRRLIRAGKIPAVKIGGQYRIRPADAEALTTPAQRPQSPRNQRERIRQMLRAS